MDTVTPQPISADGRRHVDQWCSEFEEARAAGTTPQIEHFLKNAGLEDSWRSCLFTKLVRAEFGELSPSIMDGLLLRFPEFVQELAELRAEQQVEIPAASTPSSFDLSEVSTTVDVAVKRWPQPVPGESSSLPNESSRYRVIRSHAQGGLGEVLVAWDLALSRTVALKRIKRQLDQPRLRQRFLREAAITARLQHPGIVPVYGLEVFSDGQPYYAMRLIEGRSLATQIHDHHADATLSPTASALAFRQLVQQVIEVCRTMQYAHDQGVIHRDLKPANIMVGSYGETLVVDWGLAKALDESDPPTANADTDEFDAAITQDGDVVGTLAFMSPEQAQGDTDAVGPAADVYSLGATLFCAITGQSPFKGLDRREVHKRVIAGDFPRPRAINTMTPKPLEAICLKACAKNSGDRYDSAATIARELECWLANEPVAAYRESLPERGNRLVRRYRPWVQAGVVGLTLLTIVATVSAVQIAIARNAALRLAKDKGNLLTANESMLAEKTVLATNNEHLAIEQLHAREKADLQAVASIYQQATTLLQSGESFAAMHALLTGIERVEEARKSSHEPAQTLVLPASREFTTRLDAWDRSLRAQYSATYEQLPVLEAVLDTGGMGSRIMFDDPEGRQLLFTHFTRGLIRYDLESRKEVSGMLPPGHPWLVDNKIETNARDFSTTPLGVRLKAEPKSKAIGMTPERSHVLVLGKELVLYNLATDNATKLEPPRGIKFTRAALSQGAERVIVGAHNGSLHEYTADGKRNRSSAPHDMRVDVVTITPDAKWVASACYHGLDFWDLVRDRHIYVSTTDVATLLTFSPQQSVVACGFQGSRSVQLFNPTTGKTICPPLATDGVLQAFAFSDSGQRLAYYSLPDGNKMPLMDRRAHLEELKRSQTPPVVRVWNIGQSLPYSSKPIVLPTGINLVARERPEVRALFSPTASQVAFIRSGEVILTSLDPTRPQRVSLGSPTEATSLICYSADGQRLLGLGKENRFYVWKTSTGKLETEDEWPALSKPGLGVTSPDGLRVATAIGLEKVQLWDIAQGGKSDLDIPAGVPRGAFIMGGQMAMNFSPDGRYFAAGAKTGDVLVWQTDNGKAACPRIMGKDISNTGLFFSPSNHRLVIVPLMGAARLVSFPNGQEIGQLPIGANLVEVQLSQDGNRLALCGADGRVTIWDANTAQQLGSSLSHPRLCLKMQFADDGRSLITEGNGVHRWDLETSQELGTPISGTLLAISADGRRMCIERPSGELHVVPTHRPVAENAASLRELLQFSTGTGSTSTGAVIQLSARHMLDGQNSAAAGRVNAVIELE